MSQEKITYQLGPGPDKKAALKSTSDEVFNQLKNKFGNEYDVTSSDFGEVEKDWSHEIKVRKGSKIGAEVSFKWEESKPDFIELEVDESSKFGWQLTYGILLIFLAAGAYIGYNNMEPLAFLPGKKLAGGLGALIALIPGLILLSIAKSILMKNEKIQNAQLVREVAQALSSEHALGYGTNSHV